MNFIELLGGGINLMVEDIKLIMMVYILFFVLSNFLAYGIYYFYVLVIAV